MSGCGCVGARVRVRVVDVCVDVKRTMVGSGVQQMEAKRERGYRADLTCIHMILRLVPHHCWPPPRSAAVHLRRCSGGPGRREGVVAQCHRYVHSFGDSTVDPALSMVRGRRQPKVGVDTVRTRSCRVSQRRVVSILVSSSARCINLQL